MPPIWHDHVVGPTSREFSLSIWTPNREDLVPSVGMDLMTEIGIYVNTVTKEVNWEGNVTPLKPLGAIRSSRYVRATYDFHTMSTVLQDAEERQDRILDSDYSAVETEQYVNGLSDLTTDQKHKLIKVLNNHPELFGGGLGLSLIHI